MTKENKKYYSIDEVYRIISSEYIKILEGNRGYLYPIEELLEKLEKSKR